MRRIIAALALLIGISACAQAELHTYEYDSTYYACASFTQDMPEDVQQALGGWLRPGDEVLCGARKKQFYVREARKDWDASILAAVRREGKILLVHASGINDDWEITVESDDFVQDGQDFAITTEPEDEGTQMAHRLAVGDMVYTISRISYEGNRLFITRADRVRPDGSTWTLNLYLHGGNGVWQETVDGQTIAEGCFDSVLPMRLAAWTEASFPKTTQAVQAFVEAHAPVLGEDEAYLTGVNLRERATGKSRSWGKYTARVRLLEKKTGKEAPWFHVQVGNLDGWASGVYVAAHEERDWERVCDAAAGLHDVGRARMDTALCERPNGAQTGVLTEGTLVHVLAERDGWLHVIVPRSELTWETDWDGTYGFVRAQDMAVGLSRADALWK